MSLEALIYEEEGSEAQFRLLDQRELPLRTKYIVIQGPRTAWTAIKEMAVRGAPAIAIAGALALAVELQNGGAGKQFSAAQDAQKHIQESLDYLVTSRPTAVNLSDAARKLNSLAKKEVETSGSSAESVTQAIISACKQMLLDDVAANKAMGNHGAKAIAQDTAERRADRKAVNILTHCNTGSLATAGFGTALGVVRSLQAQGLLGHVYCTETRPYNQGARLTAYELVHDKLSATLIADSAAASLMAAGKVDAVVVGADRVTACGDTANKVGTYSLAVIAARHNVPFYVAAPTTTLDAKLKTGQEIEIEERDPRELTHHQGKQVAAVGINVWNPSFDVTPADLIAGIITEKGMVPKSSSDGFKVSAMLGEQSHCVQNGHAAAEPNHGSVIPGFYALDLNAVKDYLASKPELCKRLGSKSSIAQWRVREVGDGNINYVYIVEGMEGSLVVKQGLPYLRIAHDWPLTQDRARIEADALAEEAKHCPQHVPQLYHYDPQLALIVMQYLQPPHEILRKSLVAGKVFPKLANHVGTFLAATIFNTSLLALDTRTYRDLVTKFKNTELCRLTEQVIFTDPYYKAPVNRHTSPQLDGPVAELQRDPEAKAAATRLKAIFCERQQALLHGDLHTGSFMVTELTTYAIDAEFAFYGPIAFDVSKMIANLLIAYFASAGYQRDKAQTAKQQSWLLEDKKYVVQTIEGIWTVFAANFLQFWDEAILSGKGGDLIHPAIFPPKASGAGSAAKVFQQGFMKEIFQDALAFAGAVIIRRIVGIAHVIDFEEIADQNIRANCERMALQMGRNLLVGAILIEDMLELTALARKILQQPPAH